jgi:hypothetical protein
MQNQSAPAMAENDHSWSQEDRLWRKTNTHANDAQVARTTVDEYFEILKDTLILYELPAWRKSKKKNRWLPLNTIFLV